MPALPGPQWAPPRPTRARCAHGIPFRGCGWWAVRQPAQPASPARSGGRRARGPVRRCAPRHGGPCRHTAAGLGAPPPTAPTPVGPGGRSNRRGVRRARPFAGGVVLRARPVRASDPSAWALPPRTLPSRQRRAALPQRRHEGHGGLRREGTGAAAHARRPGPARLLGPRPLVAQPGDQNVRPGGDAAGGRQGGLLGVVGNPVEVRAPG